MRKNLSLAAHPEVKTSAARHAIVRVRRRREYSRRRGQTLLLAVLLMVFAALLGATFITVVALNLSQTSRGTNRGEAQQAALAGKRYANDQIVNSVAGEKWTPGLDADPQIDVSSPNYNAAKADAYYSPFEQAQGWIYNSANPEQSYVKYPNPLAINAANRNSPTFLLNVRRIPLVSETDAEPQSPQHGGQLLIDSIGRSADDDAVFARQAAYKPTSENGGPGAFARYDSNYDFGSGRVIQTTTTAASAADVLTVGDTRGFAAGRLVMVDTGAIPTTAVVKDVGIGTITLDRNVTVAQNAIVRAASPLTGNLISGTDPTYLPNRQFDATGAGAVANATLAGSTTTLATEQKGIGGILINGGLALINQISLKLRNSATDATATDTVRVAGVIGRDDVNTTATDYTKSSDTQVNVIDAVTSNTIASYAFPANGNTSAQVQDNSASEAGDPTAAVVRPLTPGRIDGPASRWLKLTRNADINNGSQYGYDRGVYIDNVDDVEKVGRLIGGGTTADFRPLTVAETQRLWQRKSFPTRGGETGNVNNGGTAGDPVSGYTQDTSALPNNPHHRLAWKRLANGAFTGDSYTYPLNPAATPAPLSNPSTPTSLEERGIRGWVSPWEYKPRGVLIELQGNDIIITRDDRSDVFDSSSTVTSAPNPQKAWKDRGGVNPVGGGKIYRMRIDTTTGTRYFGAAGNDTAISTTDVPFNGVIYAEGNVRVRGFLNSTAPDVTIASMNNIYVEGSILRLTVGAGTDGHVALLAKNNVVLNPTLFAAPLEGSTDRDVATATNITAIAPAAVGANSLNISAIASLRVGDLVRVGKNLALLSVTGITPTAAPPGSGTITFQQSLTTDVDAAAVVRVLADPKIDVVSGFQGTTAAAPSYAYAVNGGPC